MATFKVVKPEVDAALESLKSCDFAAANVGELIRKIHDVHNKVCDNDKKKYAEYMCKQHYGQLIGKMCNTLSGYLEKDKWEEEGFKNLELMMETCSECCILCPDHDITADQFREQDIVCILTAIEKLGMHYEGNDSHEPIDGIMHYMIRIIYSSVYVGKNNRETVRERNGGDILKKLVKSDIVLIALYSLMTLAYIVDDSESNILAISDRGVSILVEFLDRSVNSSDHAYASLPAGQILDCLNRLTVHDENIYMIQHEGGIPFIVRMLWDDFDEEDQCIAAVALWNLAFIESVRKSPELQMAVPCK